VTYLEENELLKKALFDMLDAIDVGIYCKAVKSGNKAYDKRTPYMEGWNENQMAMLRLMISVLKKYNIEMDGPDEYEPGCVTVKSKDEV